MDRIGQPLIVPFESLFFVSDGLSFAVVLATLITSDKDVICVTDVSTARLTYAVPREEED